MKKLYIVDFPAGIARVNAHNDDLVRALSLAQTQRDYGMDTVDYGRLRYRYGRLR